MEWVTPFATLVGLLINGYGLFSVYRQLKIKNEHDARMEGLRLENQKQLAHENKQIEQEKDLRNRRIPVYAALWEKFRTWEEIDPFRIGVDLVLINKMLNDFSEWYSTTGSGMLLSLETDKLFGNLEFALKKKRVELNADGLPDLKQNMLIWVEIMNMITNLKRQMRTDIGIDQVEPYQKALAALPELSPPKKRSWWRLPSRSKP